MNIIAPSRAQMISERFKKEVDGIFVEAKRSTVASNPVIPVWFAILTIVLGWNELMTILSNPVLFMFLLFILGGRFIVTVASYIVYYTNMAGPIYSVAKTSAGQMGRQASKKLRDRGINIDSLVDGTLARELEVKARGLVSSMGKNDDEIEMSSRPRPPSPSKVKAKKAE